MHTMTMIVSRSFPTFSTIISDWDWAHCLSLEAQILPEPDPNLNQR
jgi:hypothetical protein